MSDSQTIAEIGQQMQQQVTPNRTTAEEVERFLAELPEEAPDPAGHRLLIAVYTPPKRTAGGVLKPDEYHDREQTSAQIGFVVALGPTAYDRHIDAPERRDPKYQAGPWVKEHDWVVLPKWERVARLRVPGNETLEFRVINDDEIVARLDDPTTVRPF